MVILGGPIKHPHQSRNKRATDSLLINVIFLKETSNSDKINLLDSYIV